MEIEEKSRCIDCTSTLEDHSDPYMWIVNKGTGSVHLLWAGENRIHSFVIQGVTSFQPLGNSHFVIDCALSEKVPEEGQEKTEVNCFLNHHSDHDIQISGARASSFELHEPISISSSSLTLNMHWFIQEGEGVFFGHLLRGNRGRQVWPKGEKVVSANDWQISLRTVARGGACTLRLNLELVKNRMPSECAT